MLKKKVLATVLSFVMMSTMLTACGSTAPAANETGTKTAEGTDAAPAGTEAAGDVDISEPVTLKMYFHGSNVTDGAPVIEKANEYLKEKLNVTLEPIWGTWGDFDQNSVLAINGGDDVDIYFTCSWSANEYNTFARKGAWVRLDDPENNLIEKYATNLWPMLPDVLKSGATTKGSEGLGVYGVPAYKDIATQLAWDINVPLLEKYGYTLDDIKNTDYYGFGEIMKTVKEGEGADFYPLLVEAMVLERMVNSTPIVVGDSPTGNVLSYYFDPADPSKDGANGAKIFNKYDTPEYKKFAEKTHEYFKAGYIDPTMGNKNQANDVRASKQLEGQYLIGTQSYAYGYEHEAATARNFEVEFVPTTPAFIDTTSSQGALMAISSTSKNPERAMMFLDLLNTDAELMTLLEYGIEGVHYNLEDGMVNFTEKRADYQPWTNGMGNVTILPPTKAQGANFWPEFKDFYGKAVESNLLGYSFDPTNVETEMGAIANAEAEYGLALNAGVVDPAEKLPEFLAKLKECGMDKVLTEANAQLDTFIQENGK